MVVTDEMIEAGQSALTDQGYDSDMIGEMGLDAVFMAMLDVRESAPPAGSTAEEIEDAAYRLAMLGLQSDRYSLDRDFSDAVDDVLNMIQQKVMSR